MPLNIPMPDLPGNALLKGLDTGGALFTRLMQPRLAREQQDLEREKQKQAHEHFLQKLIADREAAERSQAFQSRFDPLTKSIMQQKLQGLTQRNDPMFELNQYKALENMFKKRGGNITGSMPTQELGQGLGVYSPEGLKSSQSSIPNENEDEIDYEMLKQHPALRGYFKKKFGYDPLAQKESEVLHGPARDAYDLAKVKQQYGEDSEIYQNAKAQYDANLDAKKDLRDLRARTKAGLKPGEKEFFDPETGSPLGKEIPLTAKERESEEGNILFNELYPHVYKGASPFSGEGSIRRLENAASHYKTDPKARKLFDDFLLAEKMLAATTVNEASTLKAGRTNRTYGILKESLEAQDIPKLVKKLIKEYKLPPQAQLRAAMRYQKLLSDARKKARKGVPATQKLFYDPEQQAQYESQINEGGALINPDQKEEVSEVIVIDPTGKKFKTTAKNAANLPKGWKRG